MAAAGNLHDVGTSHQIDWRRTEILGAQQHSLSGGWHYLLSHKKNQTYSCDTARTVQYCRGSAEHVLHHDAAVPTAGG
jgi:hypothetical protein